MDTDFIFEIAKSNPNMTTVDRLINLYHLLSQTLVFNVPGEVLEIGCNTGTTSVFFKLIIDNYNKSKNLHVYDSFQGLPERSTFDKYLNPGECKASIEELKNNFDKYNLSYPHIHKGWFEETLPKDLPSQIAFAYLDSDFYNSIYHSLESIYPRLSKNAIVVVDDYADLKKNPNAWNGLPGVKIACDNFIKDYPESFSILVSDSSDLSMAYLRKK